MTSKVQETYENQQVGSQENEKVLHKYTAKRVKGQLIQCGRKMQSHLSDEEVEPRIYRTFETHNSNFKMQNSWQFQHLGGRSSKTSSMR